MKALVDNLISCQAKGRIPLLQGPAPPDGPDGLCCDFVWSYSTQWTALN